MLNKLTIKASLHSTGYRKDLSITMVASVVNITRLAGFSIGIAGDDFIKKIYQVTLFGFLASHSADAAGAQ